MDFYPSSNSNSASIAREKAEASLITNVYLWMCGALVITGLTAYYVSTDYSILRWLFGNTSNFWILVIAELGLVIALNALINKISPLVATLMFLTYSVLNGLMLSSIFLVYEIGTIANAFFTTAGAFGAMAIYGAVTKKDLSKIGSLCFMALIGIIIATVINLFTKNEFMDLVICWIGVIVFVGLTAYDSQKIKQMLTGAEENDATMKIAIIGALQLYLDFINLFLYILRLFGRRD